MAFTVFTTIGEHHHDDESSYEINDDNGVLTVVAGDRKRYQFSPAFWTTVEDLAPERPASFRVDED